MQFKGHQMYRIDDHWVFDMTTFIGYKVETAGINNDTVTSYSKAFVVSRSDDTSAYTFDKMVKVPIKILRKTVNIINNYRKEALLDNEGR